LKNKAVFLDRDGVINKSLVKNGKPFPPQSPSELKIIPGVLDALIELKQKDFLLIVVTNQPDVGRGKQKKKIVEEFHTELKSKLPLDQIYTCYHGQDGECECRKPKPGLLFQAAKDYDIDYKKSFMIGDRWKDIDAGNSVKCKTIFIDYNYDEQVKISANYETSSLYDAAKWILK